MKPRFDVGTALVVLAFVVVGAGVAYLQWRYFYNGYRQCRSEDSSLLWCLLTHKWQALKTLIWH